MNCSNCESEIKLQHQKDKETKMWENFWWCDKCECRVAPRSDNWDENSFISNKNIIITKELLELDRDVDGAD